MPYAAINLDSENESDNNDDLNHTGNVEALVASHSSANTSDEHADLTDKLRAALPENNNKKAARVENALNNLRSLGFDLAQLLELILWGNAACTSNQTIKTAHTQLTHYKHLGTLLTMWCHPPPPPSGGTRPPGTRAALEQWANECIKCIIEHDLDKVIAPLLWGPSAREITAKSLLGVDLGNTASNMESKAPRTWKLICHMVYSQMQERCNTFRDPNAVSIMPSFFYGYTNMFTPRLSCRSSPLLLTADHIAITWSLRC
jgi:hypothetical protein